MLQVPSASTVNVLPLTLHTVGVPLLKATARPELAVATRATGGDASVRLPGPVKLTVCAIKGAAATEKLRTTGVAAAYTALPGWLAVMLQVPTASRVRLLPLTLHTAGVVDARLTARPALELATRAGGALPRVWLPGAAKLKVCVAASTANDRLSDSAAAKTALPAWLAVTVQVPAASRLKLLPLTLHTAGVAETSVTARPELAVATSAAGVLPRVWGAGASKRRVCAAGSTVKATATDWAAAYTALPAWLATTVQVPAANSSSVLPLALHTSGLLLSKPTGRPELAWASSATTGLPRVCVPGLAKLMAWAVGSTVKLTSTAGAAAKRRSPAWLAATVQVPAAFRVSAVPVTPQMSGLVATKLTARPEVAVAANAGAGLPRVWVPTLARLRVWASRPEATSKRWLTTGAAANRALPAWLASIVHTPRPRSVSCSPLTLHTSGLREASSTGRPELALASSGAGSAFSAWLPGATKVMDWLPTATAKLLLSGAAGANTRSPSCCASSVQVPTLTRPRRVPLTVQTAGVLDSSVTGRPDDAVASKGAGVLPKRCSPGDTKLSVCGSDCEAGSAPPPQAAKASRPAQAAPARMAHRSSRHASLRRRSSHKPGHRRAARTRKAERFMSRADGCRSARQRDQ